MKLAITLCLEDVEGVQDIPGNAGDNYIRVEMPSNSFMTDLFEGSNIDWVDTMYDCTYQDASIKPTNAWKWFYTRENHAL